MEFWEKLDQIAANQEIVIDRPKGSRHRKHPEIVYPFDYGILLSIGCERPGLLRFRLHFSTRQLLSRINEH
jgi:hypothetical protein